MTDLILSGGVVAVLAMVHLNAGRLRVLDRIPRSRWLSFAGGVSVAYVFVHLLPQLASGHRRLVETGTLERDVTLYVVVLAGLVTYYVLERLVRSARTDQPREAERGGRADAVFRLHVIAFALYNAVIGYMVRREEEAPLLFGGAMALHFLVTDYGLQKNHGHAYARMGRWLVSAAIVLGWLVGVATEVPPSVTVIMTALLSGAVILNVMKEELPEERESRVGPFLLGAGGYAALLVVASG